MRWFYCSSHLRVHPETPDWCRANGARPEERVWLDFVSDGETSGAVILAEQECRERGLRLYTDFLAEQRAVAEGD